MGALFIDSVHDQMAFTGFFEQCRYRFRWLLKVFVDRDDPFAAGIGDSTQRRSMLAEIFAEADSSGLVMLLRQCADCRPVVSTTPVVYENYLELVPRGFKCELQTPESSAMELAPR